MQTQFHSLYFSSKMTPRKDWTCWIQWRFKMAQIWNPLSVISIAWKHATGQTSTRLGSYSFVNSVIQNDKKKESRVPALKGLWISQFLEWKI